MYILGYAPLSVYNAHVAGRGFPVPLLGSVAIITSTGMEYRVSLGDSDIKCHFCSSCNNRGR